MNRLKMGNNMNSEVKMQVSSFFRKDGEKSIYVMFNDSDKSAEFILPECKLLKNSGFSEDELEQLKDYIDNEKDSIYEIAKKVNPMKGFLGQKQGE